MTQIAGLLGRWDGYARPRPKVRLRKENRIRTVHASLAIEGNTLSLDQITALIDEKRVAGPKKDILEATNAIEAYERVGSLSPFSERDFLAAHRILMNGLVPDAGKYRSGQVGVLKGSKVSHVAPPAKNIPTLMAQLFAWAKRSDLDSLILSSLVHYEIEFIHPFSDGNGRMGRLWQHRILRDAHPLYEFITIEEMIRRKQKQYYGALEASDRAGSATAFVAYTLGTIHRALEELVEPKNFEGTGPEGRIAFARTHFGKRDFTRGEYLKAVGKISTATASRDLAGAVAAGELRATGKMRLTRYRFK
jgi:Fic family protein